jgi:hypothetical protein
MTSKGGQLNLRGQSVPAFSHCRDRVDCLIADRKKAVQFRDLADAMQVIVGEIASAEVRGSATVCFFPAAERSQAKRVSIIGWPGERLCPESQPQSARQVSRFSWREQPD